MSKRNIFLLILIVCFGFVALINFGTAQKDEPIDPRYQEKAEATIDSFQRALKTELMTAMQDGGPEAAISVCNEKAPQIKEAINAEDGVSIKRISLKPRNPNNTPSQAEATILEDFEAENANGTAIGGLSYERMDGDTYTYMKPIPTMPLCATCHGTAIEPDLYSHITTLYPNDKATGFKDGDIRGAFVVEIDKLF